MKHIIQILTIPTILIGFSLTATVFAWGMTTKEFIMPLIWVATIIGFILTFINLKTGLITLLISSLAWLTIFADYFGHFLTFDLLKLEKWGLEIPFVFCPLIVAILTIRQLTLKPRLRIAGILLTVLIPTIGFATYYDKTLTQTTFSEFHGMDENSKEYLGRFRATPMDARYFEVTINSQEVEEIVREKGTFLVGHYYINDTKLKVKMRFNKIKQVQLYQLKDRELKEPVIWTIDELNGQTEYLKR
ncbi:hypothetical protein [Schleiferia thermophila]|uniref:hypothetical protein n=1 Tax=Schleiferia thermophila TaxID=884107 RepID=UPI0012691897|nr:hypothetical protein [Schleiferia thermophila]